MTSAWNLQDPPQGRGLMLPTLSIVAITAFMAFGLPAIDRAIPAIGFEPGAMQSVHDQIEFMPEPGWIADGVPAPSAPSLTIFKDGVAMTIAPGAWGGTADELLTSILNDYSEYRVEGDRKPFSLPSGMEGVAMKLYGADKDGAIFALIAPGTEGIVADSRIIGVRLIVEGPSDILPELAEDVAAMLRSMRPLASGSGEAAE